MNPITDLQNAVFGWIDLIGNRPIEVERFRATRSGLNIMLLIYAALVVITHYVQSLILFGGLPGIDSVIMALLLNALPMLAVFFAIWLTVRFLKPDLGYLPLMVPAGYALVFLLVIGLLLSVVAGSTFATAMQGVLGYMLYRLARETGKFTIGVSVGFAIFSVALLVAIPIGLYMLVVPELPTPA